MKKKVSLIFLLLALIVVAGGVWFLWMSGAEPSSTPEAENSMKERIELPSPGEQSTTSIEEAIANRRSVRKYKEEPLTLEEVSQLVWAAQGITGPEEEKRAVPSAGALYPLEVYAAVREVEQLDSGVYRYLPQEHQLEKVKEEEVNSELAQAAFGQQFVAQAPMAVVITADHSVTTQKYGERGEQYVHMEAGHASQNLYLQAESLGVGTVAVGGFHPEQVREVLEISTSQTPLYIMSMGKKQEEARLI